MNILTVTTSFPTNKNPASGIFISRFLSSFPKTDKHYIVTPKPGYSAEVVGDLGEVVECVYAPARWSRLFHSPGGGPAALSVSPVLYLFIPSLIVSMFISCVRQASRVDVIHAHWTLAGILAALAGKVARKPVVTTLHGQDVNRAQRSKPLRLLLWGVVKLSDRVVVVSEGMEKSLLECYPESSRKISFISNGVSQDLLLLDRKNTKYQPFNILVVASLIPAKGVELLVRAFAEIKDNALAKLIVVGDGSEKSALQLLVNGLEMESRICFKGAVDPGEMIKMYADAHLLVSASYAEGRPSVVLEAMAAGLPVLLSDISAHLELLAANKSGDLFKSGDKLDLTQKLQKMLDNRERMESFGRSSREFVVSNGLTWDSTVEKYRNLYQSLLSSSRS